MKHFFAALLASCLLAGCVSAPIRTASTAPASPKPLAPARAIPPIAARIGAFIAQPRFAHADWGISVVSLDSGKTLYAHDAHKLFAPASNAKLYTAALALSSLGEVRFGTTLYATAATGPSGALDGDLILYGGGDPSLGKRRPRRTGPISSRWRWQTRACIACAATWSRTPRTSRVRRSAAAGRQAICRPGTRRQPPRWTCRRMSRGCG
jgi:hypothetical protein